jgi:hypothetical protein
MAATLPQNEHIDVSRADEVAYWTKALAIDEQQLRNAVKAVGSRLADIRRHIEEHQARR